MKKKIGIIGGGQLGMMLTEAALPLGFEVVVLDPASQNLAPAFFAGAKHLFGDLNDAKAINELASRVDYLTWEIEHINVEILKELKRSGVKISPDPETLETIKDKLTQKQFLKTSKIPVAPFWEIDSIEVLESFAKKFGFPFILKNRFGGFDGRGNFKVKSKKDIVEAFEKLGGKNLYAEGVIDFKKEIAFIAARDLKGEVITYPIVETIHKGNICDTVIFPARISKEVMRKAGRIGRKVMKSLKGSGVFAIEMFIDKDGEVFVNEIAPRVHNSGHLTIETFRTSQFENHIRAVTGMELGITKLKDRTKNVAIMKNILFGSEDSEALSRIAIDEKDVYLHSYHKAGRGKEIPRKIGHITGLGNDFDEVMIKVQKTHKLASKL